MKLIYSNENQFLVNNAKNILENNQIEVTLKNEFASGAAGVLAPLDTWVELWLVNDIDEEQAKQVLAKALKQQDVQDWLCPQCQENNDASFELCWQCQSERNS